MKNPTFKLIKAAGKRAFRTFIQALVASAPTVYGLNALTYEAFMTMGAQIALVLISAIGSAAISFLTGVLGGLPEVKDDKAQIVDNVDEEKENTK